MYIYQIGILLLLLLIGWDPALQSALAHGDDVAQGVQTVRDEFDDASYSNNDGTANWSGNWVESDDSGGASSGSVQISGGELRLNGISSGQPRVQRQANLTGVLSANLTFDFRTSNNLESSDHVALDISFDGGSSWETLEHFYNDNSGSRDYDITSFISGNTVIRFVVVEFYGASNEHFYVDNVQIEYTEGGPPPGAGVVRDEFNEQSYSNNDGSVNWFNSWEEIGESNGPTSGDIQVENDAGPYQLRIRDDNKGAWRQVDLSNAATATLRFDYRRESLDDADEYVTLTISTSGSSGPWIELDRFTGPADDASYTAVSYDISAFVSSNTVIRFYGAGSGMNNSDMVYFDDVEVEFSDNDGGGGDGGPGGGGTPGTITGMVFRDYNADGTKSANEPPVEGVEVRAFDVTGAEVDMATTNTAGEYTLDVNEGVDVRIEFTAIPSYLVEGASGPDSGSSVVFVTSSDVNVDLALHNPGQYCTDSTDLGTSCFFFGDPAGSPNPLMVSIPETAGSNSNVDENTYEQPAATRFGSAEILGAVWGLAYRPENNVIYAATLVKRHTDFGGIENPTTIYQIDRSTGGVNSWITLDPSRGNPHSGNNDLHGWNDDYNAFNDVFKQGLGDIDISDDHNTLYTIDLGTRKLFSIPILSNGGPGTPSTVDITAAVWPDLSAAGCPNQADVRPFGLGFNDGTLYMGVVCSAQSTVDDSIELPIDPGGAWFTRPGDRTKLRGYVYAWDGSSFTQVLAFPLDYNRGCAAENGSTTCTDEVRFDARWSPWVDTFPYRQPASGPQARRGQTNAPTSDLGTAQ